MNAVTRKFKSKSGISLAIALVFFLLCAMVGTVVLSAASAGAGNTARERQLYRQTFALTSAAELLSQDIRAISYTGSYTRTETVTTTVDPDGKIPTKVETSEDYKRESPQMTGSQLFHTINKADGTYSDNLNLTERYFMNQEKLSDGTTVVSVAQTIKFQAVVEQNIPEVTGSVQVEEDYTLNIVLWCGDNSLTMSFPPKTASKTVLLEPKTTKIDGTTTQKITGATYYTTLTWGQPIMKEGGR